MRQIDPNETDKLGQIILDVKNKYEDSPIKFILKIVATILLSILTSSIIVEWWMMTIRKQDAMFVSHFMTSWCTNIYSIVLTLLVMIAVIKVQYKFSQTLKKDYVRNYEENYDASISGVYGDAHWQTEKERKECFKMVTDIKDTTDDILCIDKKNRIYSLRNDLVGINKNKIVFGSAGSGKSAAIALNEIFQAIRRGDSLVVTDSKGDLYADTSKLARKKDYIVRVLNLKAKELKNSDGWDVLKYVTIEDPIQAEVLAKAIINNTLDGPMDYWATNEMNCLKSLILYVATNDQYVKSGKNRMKEVANLFNSYDSAGLSTIFSTLPPNHPAKTAFNKFDICDPKIKAQILNGMTIRLSLLDDFNVKNIVSNDEIDLVLPMKKKCIYYIVISDTDTSTKFLAAMFFTQLFMEQCDYSDALPKKYKKEHQLRVKYVLDEFANIGAIPFFDIKISTFRSRKIEATIIMQSVSQLKNMYPNDVDQTILGNITTKILLKAGDIMTAKYFSDLCGQLTVKVENGRFTKAKSNVLDAHDSQTVTEGLGKRELLLQDKAMKLDANTIVICILGFQPIKELKYIAELSHPMYQEIVETQANKHLPKWRKELQDKEKKLKERKEAYFHQTGESVKENKKETSEPVVKKQNSTPTVGRPKTSKPENTHTDHKTEDIPEFKKKGSPTTKPPIEEVKENPTPSITLEEIDEDDIPEIVMEEVPEEPQEPSKPVSRLERVAKKNAVTSMFD